MRYFEIGWHSKLDGPGNRVVIYLQGCNLRCPWCHSPHSWPKTYTPVLFNAALCKNCGRCVDVCKQGVHQMREGIHIVEREKCIGCGECQKACPNSRPDYLGGTLCLPTKEKEAEEIFELVRPQLEMFRYHGGVTLSGGEALLQADEVKQFLMLCREHGISTCIESSFSLPAEAYEKVSGYTDYWLAGLRDIYYEKGYEKNDKEIVKKIMLVKPLAKQVIARYPLIEGYTTSWEQVNRFQDLMDRTEIRRVELLPCNPDMMHYYRLTGIKCSLAYDEVKTTKQQQEDLRIYFERKGFIVGNN